MLRAFFALLVFVPSLVFARVEVYEGSGVWKKSDGESGSYTVLVHKTYQSNGSVRIIKTITESATNESMTWSFVISPDQDGFATVSREDGTPLGRGYYFEKHGKMIGHIDMETEDGTKVEKTVCLEGQLYKSIGSHTNSDGTLTTWSESGNLIHP